LHVSCHRLSQHFRRGVVGFDGAKFMDKIDIFDYVQKRRQTQGHQVSQAQHTNNPLLFIHNRQQTNPSVDEFSRCFCQGGSDRD